MGALTDVHKGALLDVSLYRPRKVPVVVDPPKELVGAKPARRRAAMSTGGRNRGSGARHGKVYKR